MGGVRSGVLGVLGWCSCRVCLLVSVPWCLCWCSVLAVVSEVSVRCVFAVGLSCCVLAFLRERSPSVKSSLLRSSRIECFAALPAAVGMPSGRQLDSCTAVLRCRARIQVASSEHVGAAQERCKTFVDLTRKAHRRRAGEGRAASSHSSARFESQPVFGRAHPS